MLKRTLGITRNFNALDKYLRQKSVPHRTPEDLVAIVSNTANFHWSPVVSDILSTRLIGLQPSDVFQIVTAVYRRREKTKVPPELLNLLLSALIDASGHRLDSAALIRGIEMIRELSGQYWDPNHIAQSSTVQRIVRDTCTPLRVFIRLLSLGGDWDTRSLINRVSSTISPYDLARIAYLTGNFDAYSRAAKSVTADSFAFLMKADAAWDFSSGPSWISNVPRGIFDQLSPYQAQVSLWSGLAMGVDKSLIQILEVVANREPWRQHHMYEQYRMISDPGHSPNYPIRIPQLGLERKHLVAQRYKDLLSGCGLQETRQSLSDTHLFDICVNDSFYIDIVTYPNDPNYRVYKKLVSPKYPVIEVQAHATADPSTINDIVRPYL
jgi:hypothetical protein